MSVQDNARLGEARIPRYRQIADVLRGEIRHGVYPPGSLLPIEHELAERFNTSRQTVREALRVLDERGLILRRAGKGTLVIDRGERPLLNLAMGDLGQLLSYPKTIRRRHIEVGQFVTDEASAPLLGCAPGRLWMRARAVRVDAEQDVPICWVDIFILPKYESVLRRPDVESNTVVGQIEKDYGVAVENAEVDIGVGRIAPEMATALAVRPSSPALTVVRRYFDSAGELFEVTVSTHPESRYTYQLKLSRGKR